MANRNIIKYICLVLFLGFSLSAVFIVAKNIFASQEVGFTIKAEEATKQYPLKFEFLDNPLNLECNLIAGHNCRIDKIINVPIGVYPTKIKAIDTAGEESNNVEFNINVLNNPPTIKEPLDCQIEAIAKRNYECQIEASDPDGHYIVYELNPEARQVGLQIDQNGLISGQILKGKENAKVKVTVRDEYLASTTAQYSLKINDYCGNGKVEAIYDEQCEALGEGTGPNDQYDCVNCRWFGGYCGNNKIDSGSPEICDGINLGGKTCLDLGNFNIGTPICSSDCLGFDNASCSCANVSIDVPNSSYTIYSNPSGNYNFYHNETSLDILNIKVNKISPEPITSYALSAIDDSGNNASWISISDTGSVTGDPGYLTGTFNVTIAATNSCGNTGSTFFTVSVLENEWCGDGKITNGETCENDSDGNKINYGAGTTENNQYSCDNTCHQSGGYCGNNKIDSGSPEICDGINLGGKTCLDLGNFDIGTPTCSSDCLGFDNASCSCAPVSWTQTPPDTTTIYNYPAGAHLPLYHGPIIFNATVEATDADNITYSLATKPSWLNINSSTGVISGTPRGGDEGEYDLTVRAVTLCKTIEKPFKIIVLTNEYCGDGNPNGSEVCESGEEDPNNPGYYCKNDCSGYGYCGDNILTRPPEECDPGDPSKLYFGSGAWNINYQYECANDCTLTGGWCGDGQWQPGYEDCDYEEDCDPIYNGNCDRNIAQTAAESSVNKRYGCQDTASRVCTFEKNWQTGEEYGWCGDGKVQNISTGASADFEECDDGNDIDGDGCNTLSASCQHVCGDGHLDTSKGEECDPNDLDSFGEGRNENNQYECDNSCKQSGGWCGDDIIQNTHTGSVRDYESCDYDIRDVSTRRALLNSKYAGMVDKIDDESVSSMYRRLCGLHSCDFSMEEISNCNDLQSVNSGHYVLLNDIDCTGVNFEPLNNVVSIFGNNNKIKNLHIDRVGESNIGLVKSKIVHVGGFHEGNEFVAQDIIFEKPTVIGDGNVGVVIGSITYSKIKKVLVKEGEVEGNNMVGGLVGGLGYSSSIYSSGFEGIVSGLNSTGGLVGGIDGRYSKIVDSYVIGEINGNNSTGGLAGINSEGVYSENNYTVVSINGNNGIGGLIGDNSHFRDSYWNKEVCISCTPSNGSLNTLEMLAQSSYGGWDFTDIWTIQPGSYPCHQWWTDLGNSCPTP